MSIRAQIIIKLSHSDIKQILDGKDGEIDLIIRLKPSAQQESQEAQDLNDAYGVTE